MPLEVPASFTAKDTKDLARFLKAKLLDFGTKDDTAMTEAELLAEVELSRKDIAEGKRTTRSSVEDIRSHFQSL